MGRQTDSMTLASRFGRLPDDTESATGRNTWQGTRYCEPAQPRRTVTTASRCAHRTSLAII